MISFQFQLLCPVEPTWGKPEIRLVDALAAQAAAKTGHEVEGEPQEVTDEEGKTIRFWMLKEKA